MNRFIKFIILILCFMSFSLNIKAECKDRKINDYAEEIDIIFFVPQKESDFSKEYLDKIGKQPNAGYAYYFLFSKEKFDDGTRVSDIFRIEALDGKGVPGIWKYQEPIAKFGVGGYNGVDEEVYTLRILVNDGVCKDNLVKETTYTIPQFNMYKQTAYCEKYPDHELCQTFTNKTANMNDAEFGKAMAEYEKELKEKQLTLRKLFIMYYQYIICAVVPFIAISIFYRRRIRRIKNLKTQEEERHIIRRKAGLFLVLFLLFIPGIKADSTCGYHTTVVRQTIAIPGVNVSVYACGWGNNNSWTGPDFGSSIDINRQFQGFISLGPLRIPFNIPINISIQAGANYAVARAVEWGAEEANANVTDCYGDTVFEGKIARCIMKENGGLGYVIVNASREVTCSDTGSACTGTKTVYTKRDCTDEEKNEGKTDCYDSSTETYKGLKCWGGGDCLETSACEDKTHTETFYGEYKGADDANGPNGNKACEGAKGKLETWAGNNCDKVSGSVTIDYGSDSCPAVAQVKCPTYPCHREDVLVETTIDEISIDRIVAYCVNPGATVASDYQAVEIDPNECVNGNSSVDCGFVNILLEAEYFNKITQGGRGYQISKQIINLAMRLWGAYTNQGGYNTIGIGPFGGANCRADFGELGQYPGDTCYDLIFIDPATNKPSNTYMNVYVRTMEYMLQYPEYVTSSGILPEKLGEVNIADAPNLFTTLNCIPESGILCGTDNNIKYALALFYNTRNGNKDFFEHLNAVYGKLSVKPTNIELSPQSSVKALANTNETIYSEAGCITDSNGNCKTAKTLISLEFNEEITKESGLIDCTAILKKQKEGKTLTENEAKVINYCKIRISEITVTMNDGTYITYVDDPHGDYYWDCKADGCHKVNFSGAIGGVSHCQKSMCVIDTKVFADCDYDIKTITAKLEYEESPSLHGFRKYVSCNAPNPRATSGNLNQFLYQIVPVTDPGATGVTTTINVDITPDCRPNDPARCKDLTVKESSKKCSDPTYANLKNIKTEKTNVYDTSIHDPSLSCIVNASSEDKRAYDYSDYFGVNTDICRIYCSDSTFFYLADKVMLYTGLSFKYDIEYGKYRHNISGKSLTSIVEMRRDCVSEIFFDYNHFDKTIAAMANKYGFTKPEQLEQYYSYFSRELGYEGNNFVSLYKAVYTRSKDHESGRYEILNKLIYDLYNCNLYTSGVPVEKPRDDTTGLVFDNVIKKRFEDNYAFEDCTLNANTNDCINYEGVTYSGGAAYAKDSVGLSAKPGVKEVGDAVDTIQYKHTLDLNTNSKAEISDVRYCKGKGCFDYVRYVKTGNVDENIKEGEYSLPKARKNMNKSPVDAVTYDESTKKYVSRSMNSIEYEGATPLTRVVEYIDNKRNTNQTITIPANDFAYFSISTKVGFYNDSSFQVEQYTGNVYDVTSGSPYAETEKEGKLTRDNRTSLEKGLYPVAAITNECTVIGGSKKGEPYYKCAVDNHFGEIHTFHRNFGKLYNGINPISVDPFYMAINNAAKTTFSCSYITKYPFDSDSQAIYRNIDLRSFFPSNRRIGKNWTTEKAVKYREVIESFVKENGEVEYYNTRLEYSYTLSQEALKKVREDNAKNKSYRLDNIDIPGADNLSRNTYIELKTKFIDEIENNSNNKYGIINNRATGSMKYQRGKSIYTMDIEAANDNVNGG